MAGNCLYGFVYYDLCILDRFMSAMYIVQSGLCIVFAHNGAVAAHYFPDNNVYYVCTHIICIVYCETSNIMVAGAAHYFPDNNR